MRTELPLPKQSRTSGFERSELENIYLWTVWSKDPLCDYLRQLFLSGISIGCCVGTTCNNDFGDNEIWHPGQPGKDR